MKQVRSWMRVFFGAPRMSGVVLAALVLGCVSLMIVPIPALLLDVLLAANLASAVVLLVLAIFISQPTQLRGFPSILLLTTLLRLSLNVASSRLILSRGTACDIIEAFGEVVVGGDVAVGLVLFGIVTIIQLVVVTKGAERVAEVAARFTLDAMPGAQMSIDADLRNGVIAPEEGERRRLALQARSQLYGAMDGAMKFVKGDAIAGLIIVTLNLLGGIVVGYFRFGYGLSEAFSIYAHLSVGDGLVSQIPSMMVTVCAGLIVTRTDDDGEKSPDLGSALSHQVLGDPRVLRVSGAFMCGLGLVPGLPLLPFVALGAACFAGAWLRSKPTPEVAGDASPADPAVPELPSTHRAAALTSGGKGVTDRMIPMVVPVLLEYSPDLERYLGSPEGRFQREILPALRDTMFFELGFRVPEIRVRPNTFITSPSSFVVYTFEVATHLFEVAPDRVLVGETVDRVSLLGLEATPAQHPVTGAAACLVGSEHLPILKELSVRAWDVQEQVGLVLSAELRKNARRFVGIQEVQVLLDQLATHAPALVAEVVPKVISVARLTEVLQMVVEEDLSIRDMRLILQSMAKWAPTVDDNEELVERLRSDMSAYISQKYAQNNCLSVYTVSPDIEDMIRTSTVYENGTRQAALDPVVLDEILRALRAVVTRPATGRSRPVLLTDFRTRRHVARLIQILGITTPVLAFPELHPMLEVQPLGEVAIEGL